MNSYFFYYFSDVDGSTPFFEVVNCRDDEHAVARCIELLRMRNAACVEVWLGDRLVRKLEPAAEPRLDAGHLAANPPHQLSSLAQ